MQEIKAAVVVNPASANGKTGQKWPEMAAAFENEGLSFVYSLTEAPGHATEITARYLHEGYNLIISVGGDGTANEVINGFFTDGIDDAIRETRAFSFVSTGTGRDLSRTVGIPKDAGEAIRHIIDSPVRPVDAGRVQYINNQGYDEERYFINVAGLGLDGDTVARVNRTSKALGGFISFLWGTVVSLFLYKNQKMKIVVDGKEVCNEPITIVVVGNGCYFGGGMFVAPGAEMDDGLFDIIILRNLSKMNLLINLPRVYRGKHLSHPRIMSLRGKNIEITSSGKALLNLDGEQPGRAPASVELIPGVINLKG
ncbi:MAG: diacylglycerol kinase family lipid kinase [Bacillota bacterium]|nr:diacylglycerol kinase family lipid kinase [Bacillota bacterium]